MNNLSDTITSMCSADYKERFKAEYFQLRIRMENLISFLNKYRDDKLDFQPTCSYDLLNSQLKVMSLYALFLEERAEIEGVDLNGC